MSDAPKWLIGGPKPAEEPKTPQQAVQPVKLEDFVSAVLAAQGTYKGKTAAQWTDMADRMIQRDQESFQRSDTDGALSQMGNNLRAREYRLCAELAAHGGIWTFPALYTLTGALVPEATYVKTYMGKWVWRVGSGQDVTWFDASRAKDGSRRRKNDAAKGFYVGAVRARGYVGTASSGRGSGGMLSVGYFIGQVPRSPVEIVDNGIGDMNLRTQYEDW